jgi:hypothetical protein
VFLKREKSAVADANASPQMNTQVHARSASPNR